MKTNYQYCLTQLLKDEGGYTNHPDDKGGPTNYGITIADYRKYIKQNGTAQDVKNMTLDQAKAIYKSKYWDAVDGDNLQSGVDYTVFDYGVNSGVSRAIKVKNQFKDVTNPIELINKINDERLRFMHAIRGGHDWSVFGKGWQRRVDGVRTNSIKLVKAPQVVSTTTGNAPATTAAVGAAAGGAIVYSYWDLFLQHWMLYGLGFIVTAIVVDVAVHAYKNRKITNA